jgi:hypothetical protein
MSTAPNCPSDHEAIQGLIDAIVMCNKHPPKEPTSVKEALLNILENQYPEGPGGPQQEKLGCCVIGMSKLPQWTKSACEGIGGTWTAGPCP